jgi:hypothetical protein
MVRPPAKAPKERRRSERCAVNEIVRNESRGTPVGLGRLKDVSLGNAYLETSPRSQRTGPLKLRLTSVDVGADVDRCWLARVTSPEGGVHDVAPKLQVAWNAQDLVFLARGNGSFVLAYGNGSALAASAELGPLLKGVTIQQAELGTPRSAGGPARLQPAPRVVPWKMVILWSTLGLGILLLGWMAYRLSREVLRTPDPKT